MKNKGFIIGLALSLALAISLLGGWAVVRADQVNDVKQEIDSLSQNMQDKRQLRDQLQSKVDEYRRIISQKQAASASLEDEIGLLDNDIAKSQLNIDIANDDISQLELEIKALNGQIDDEQQHLETQQAILGGLVRKLFQSQFGRSPLENLLINGTLAGYFDHLQATADLQAGMTKAAVQLKAAKATLETNRQNKTDKETSLGEEKRQLELAKSELEDSRQLKQNLLLETKASEAEYRYAVAELQKEQSDADTNIRYLEQTLREKKDLMTRLSDDAAVIAWPVDHTRGISTLFHDPDYPFRYVFEHPGVDIRCYQGTPVRAAAAGIATAHNGGMAYSYVMIIHSNNLSTVYGHLSKIIVKSDAYVERGQVIGYSGGTPGTPGAGPLTTGPHLHFEVRDRGIPVDPLHYLPKD